MLIDEHLLSAVEDLNCLASDVASIQAMMDGMATTLASAESLFGDVLEERPTLRDRFALVMLQGMIFHVGAFGFDPEPAVRKAYGLADAMLRERAKHAGESGAVPDLPAAAEGKSSGAVPPVAG